MKFFTQDHGQLVEEFDAPNHYVALDQFREKYGMDTKLVLRDWQKYIVTEATVGWCVAFDSIARLREK